MTTTYKVIDPSDPGHLWSDYTSLGLAITGERNTVGDLVLICRRGRINGGNAIILTNQAFSSLTIVADDGCRHNGTFSQAIPNTGGNCAWLYGGVVFPPPATATTACTILRLLGLRFEHEPMVEWAADGDGNAIGGKAGVTYNLEVRDCIERIGGTDSADYADAVQCVLSEAATLNLLMINNFIMDDFYYHLPRFNTPNDFNTKCFILNSID